MTNTNNMKFTYVGTMPDQTVTKGTIKAQTEREARALIEEQDIDIILLKKKGSKAMQKEMTIGHVSDVNLLFFVKHLSIMLRAGIAIFEALTMLKEQSKGRMKIVLQSVLDKVESGETLSDALSSYPKDFPELFVQLVGSGELSGTLEKNLNYIANFMQKEIELKKKVRGAMLYPAVVFIGVLGLTMAVGLFVLPQILPLFESLDVKLPLSTRILIWFAEFFRDFGILVVIFTIMASFMTPVFLELKMVKPISHRIYLRLPIAGTIIRHLSLSRFFTVLATLMEAGLPIDESLSISAKIIHNVRYRNAIISMRKSVMQGNDLADVMDDNNFLFPILVSHMMKVGEKSGNLVDSLNYVGIFYEAEVDDKLKNLSTLLEPVLLIFIGIIVGFVAISIIGPIYSLSAGI